MEGTGRRWSIKGAESTLLLRSVYTSNDWDAYWENHRQQEQKRQYGKILPLLACSDDFSKNKAA
ncbi:conserved domain protein [delta proteobacterium NaphS2]|nr:conserved domain protein [delta proteobacterium NaphS2]